ncbi:MAG: hypothetical protein Ct9H300mP19_20310 [Dehalococcoidia bacterium]|nr:MAG: hypothetical protein Ct9H300mP19_20310 [Dehalococcoidia bacterium]
MQIVLPLSYTDQKSLDQGRYWSMIARLADVTPEMLEALVAKPALRTKILRFGESVSKSGSISSSQVEAALEQGDS